MNKTIKIILLFILAIVWMICIYKLSSMNSNNSNGKSTGILSIFIEDALDITNEYGITNSHPSDEKIERISLLINTPMRKVMHASVYFVLSFFLMILLNILLEHKKIWITIILTSLLCIFFAIGDEYHQTFVDGRTGQTIDIVIDTIGSVLGLLFYLTYEIVYKHGYNKALNDNAINKIN